MGRRKADPTDAILDIWEGMTTAEQEYLLRYLKRDFERTAKKRERELADNHQEGEKGQAAL